MRYLLPQAVTNAAERSPDSEAVRYMDRSLTYAELDNKSNCLARVLLEQKVKRGDRVGIFMNKGIESAIAIYGIMKAGAAYVPIDPFAPVSRAGFVIQDCGIRHLITNQIKINQVEQILYENKNLQYLLGVQPHPDISISCTPWEEVFQSSSHSVNLHLTELDLAYILYTSGSTGTPKGIMHTHRSGLSFAEWASNTYDLVSDDRLSNHAPLHFDLSTFDFFSSAISGATTVIIPEAFTKFPTNMAKVMEDERISIWYSVPFALIQLMQRGEIATRDLSALRWILFAGEVFPTKHLRQLMMLFPDIRFSNLFGPTETNVCTYYHVPGIPADTDETIPIGKPCANIEDLVVDNDDQPVAQGEAGELLIRGGVVMKGYWGQPDRTERGFYRRPAFDYFEDHFYRTGDLVQLDADGNYRYLGRKDRQIKTRGYRVELDEIEVALLSSGGVHEAAVYPIPDGLGSNLVHASVILKNNIVLDEDELKNHVAGKLPAYAVPHKIEILQDFPRTSTGKIDRRKLQSQANENLNN